MSSVSSSGAAGGKAVLSAAPQNLPGPLGKAEDSKLKSARVLSPGLEAGGGLFLTSCKDSCQPPLELRPAQPLSSLSVESPRLSPLWAVPFPPPSSPPLQSRHTTATRCNPSASNSSFLCAALLQAQWCCLGVHTPLWFSSPSLSFLVWADPF